MVYLIYLFSDSIGEPVEKIFDYLKEIISDKEIAKETKEWIKIARSDDWVEER